MGVTVNSLLVSDLPMTLLAGTADRKRMFFMTGVTTANTDSVSLKAYDANLKSIDFVNIIVPTEVKTYTINSKGTVEATVVTKGTSFTSAGTLTPGTVGTFGLSGAYTIY